MNLDDRLDQLIEAEKAVSIPADASTEGWQRVVNAVRSGTPAMSVPLSTIAPALASLVVEGAAVGVAVGVIAATAVMATASDHRAPVLPVPTSSALPESKPLGVSSVQRRQPAEEASLPERDLEVARAQALRPPPVAGASARAASTLEQEMQLISRAKRELDRGQPHLAQVWLEEHRAKYPVGVLSAERDGLRVLIACGDPHATHGQAWAEDYAAKYPGSPQWDRIRRACVKEIPGKISK